MLTSQWRDPYEDSLEIFSVPVGVMQQAVENMRYAKPKSEDVHKSEKEAFIMTVLGIVFAIVPFIEVLGGLGEGFTSFGRLVVLIGNVGDTAVNFHAIAENPEAAPLILIGTLAGNPGIKLKRTGNDFETLKESKITMTRMAP